MLGNKFLSVAGAPEPTDAKFNYVTMLLHGDGTNGAQNNTFLDSSTNNFTITRNGNTTQGSFSPYGSNWSNYFDGGVNYLTTASSSNLALGTGDFTVECWIYWSGTVCRVMGGNTAGNSGLSFDINSSGKLGWGSWLTGAYSTQSINANSWNHFAYVRASGSDKLYINGVLSDTATWGLNFTDTVFYVGIVYNTNIPFSGYISNVRIVKGTAVYSGSTYTVPTAPLTAISGTSLLTCQSNRFVDNSSSPLTLTVTGSPKVQRFNPFGTSTAYSTATIGGSGYFDGTGDYLQLGYNAALDLGTSDFTIDAWVYTDLSVSYVIVGMWETTTGRSYNVSVGTNGLVQINTSSTGNATGNTATSSPTGAVKANQWNHIRISRVGTTCYMGVNGVITTGSVVSSIFSSGSRPTLIGAYISTAPALPINGYLSDVRIIKGTALDTGSTYTVPTAPLTAVTNTSLLTNFTNGAIYDNAMMNDLETVGNAQISTSVKKYGTGSIAFDGTGDWLSAPSSPQLNMGASSFTIEGWFYPSGNVTAGKGLFGKRTDNGTIGGILFYFSSTGLTPRLLADIGGAWSVDVTASSGFTNAQWNHFAVVRNGSTWTIYINGTSVGSTTNSGTVRDNTAAFTWMAESAAASEGTTAGYLDDLRITKGYARYTTTFTPPTSALADKSSS